MKKTITIILICSFVIVAVLIVFLRYNSYQEEKNNVPDGEKEISREEIIEMLKNNEDGFNYIEKYKNFRIEEKTLLTEENILEGQEGERFKEIYEGLDLENDRYLKVTLMDSSGTRGLIAILDLKNESAPKAYGLILIQSEVQE